MQPTILFFYFSKESIIFAQSWISFLQWLSPTHLLIELNWQWIDEYTDSYQALVSHDSQSRILIG